MTAVFSRLMSFAGRHWLRLLIAGCALILLSNKQVNFNIRLGSPAPGETHRPAADPPTVPAATADPRVPVLTDKAPSPPLAAKSKAGFFDRLNLFGDSDSPDAYDLLTRQDERTTAAFIRRFSNVAQAEQAKFGIPASITLASAMLFSNAGVANVAKDHQNYFALGCTADWSGLTVRSEGRCYRTYENAWTSFRDHSLFVTSARFAPMNQFSETDYRRWAAGLEELEFNGSDDLAELLLRTIDRYQLFRFD